MKYICSGMAFLHNRGVIHGDLKSANVLFDSAGTAKVTRKKSCLLLYKGCLLLHKGPADAESSNFVAKHHHYTRGATQSHLRITRPVCMALVCTFFVLAPPTPLMMCQIADFGTARWTQHVASTVLATAISTTKSNNTHMSIAWAAPEVWKHKTMS